MSLTDKQQAFVNEYIVDFIGSQAAIRAGYSAKTAEVQASKLLRNPNVSGAVADAIESRTKRTQIDADWVLKQAAEAFTCDLSRLYDERGDLRPVHEWPKEIMPIIGGVEIEALYEGSGKERVQIGRVKKLKLTERLKLLETIGKHVNVQAFRERVEHDLSDGVKDLLNQVAENGRRVGGR